MDLIHWDENFQGFQIMNIKVIITRFQELIHDIIKSAKKLLNDILFFEMNRSYIDLKSLKDIMTKNKYNFSIIQNLLNHLEKRYHLILSQMKLMISNKRLLKNDDEWDRKRILKYLNKKRWFLELLILIMHLINE